MEQKITHSDIKDMPDVGGSNRDHDRRYFIRGQDGRYSEKLVSGSEKILITVSETEPTSPLENDLWVDTTRNAAAVTLTATAAATTYPDAFCYLCDATSGAIILTMDSAVTVSYRNFFIKKIDVSGNTVTIEEAAASGQTFDGAGNLVLTARWDYAHIISDGSNWYVLGKVIT